MLKKYRVSVYITEQDKQRFRDYADSSQRSLSNAILVLALQRLEELDDGK